MYYDSNKVQNGRQFVHFLMDHADGRSSCRRSFKSALLIKNIDFPSLGGRSTTRVRQERKHFPLKLHPMNQQPPTESRAHNLLRMNQSNSYISSKHRLRNENHMQLPYHLWRGPSNLPMISMEKDRRRNRRKSFHFHHSFVFVVVKVKS